MKDFARASALAGFGEFSQTLGLDPISMLARAGLPENILEQTEGVISYTRFLRLLELSAIESGDSLFGLKFGLYQGVSVLGPLLYLIRNCQTFGDAMKELQQFFHLHMGAAQIEFSQYGELSQLAYKVHNSDQEGLNQGMELALGVGYQLLRTLLGKQWQAKAIYFEHYPHNSAKQYQKLLGKAPFFQHEESAIVFESIWLNAPLKDADPELHLVIRRHLNSMEALNNQELTEFVAYLLRNLLAQGQANIDNICQCMAISKRTLQRRLAEHDTSFKLILDDTRKNMAQRYLDGSRLQLSQLSDLLGYASLSAFTRAYIRWHGHAPSYRNKTKL